MDGRSAHGQAPRRARRPHLLLLLAPAAATKFVADPARYLAPAHGARRAGARRAPIYTCPMHPRDPPDRPGLLPDLRHGARAADGHAPSAGPNPELVDMTRRFWIGLALTLPVVVLEMGGAPRSACTIADRAGRLSNWIQLALATPVVLWAGWPFFVRGWQSLVTRNLNMFTLIALGTGVGVALQRRRDARARHLSRRRSAMHDGAVAGLLRGRGGHHRAGAARPGAGAARARADRRRDPRAARPRAEDRAPRARRRHATRTCRSTHVARRRPPARAAGREGAGRRRRRSKAAARSTNRW